MHHWRELDGSMSTSTLDALHLPVCFLPVKLRRAHGASAV